MAINNLGSTLGAYMGAVQPNTAPSTNLTDYPVEVRAVIYSQMIMEEIQDNFLPEGLTRDVSEFSDGARIVIPQLGEVTVSDVSEGSSPTAQALATSNIELTIQQYKGSVLGMTDEMKQDSYMASQIESAFPRKMLRALAEDYETDMLSQQSKQLVATAGYQAGAYGQGTGAVAGTAEYASAYINGVPHRWIAAGTGSEITLHDFIAAKLSFDKANMPTEGRILVCDPVVEATLNSLVGASAFSTTQHWEAVLDTGFAQNHRFIANIYGFDVYISNRVDFMGTEATLGTFDQMYASTEQTGKNYSTFKANIFMCIADEETMPLMSAWRKMPSIEGDREVKARTDYFYSTARWGMGIQRPEAMIVVGTSAVNF